MIYDKRSYDIMKYIEDTLQTPIVGIKTDDFEAMEKVSWTYCCTVSTVADANVLTDTQGCHEEVEAGTNAPRRLLAS